MTKKTKQRLVLVLFPLLTACSQPPQQGLKASADNEWSSVAQADLNFVHETIKAAHPGVLEQSDTAFQDWFSQGYSQALALAKKAQTREQALAALRFYTVGFKDGHLGIAVKNYSSETYWAHTYWAGWTMQKHDKDFVVTYHAKDWPVAVPPLGSRVIACDEQPVSTLLATKIAPYIDTRLNLLATWSLLAQLVTIETPTSPLWEPQRIKHCLVEIDDKTQKDYALFWKNSGEGANQAFVSQPKQEIKNLGKGIYWIHASNFQPNRAESIELEKMLEQLRTLGQAKTVVLDTRGNGGGNGVIGDKILRALLKNSMPLESNTYTVWRVSSIAKSALEKYITLCEQTLGKESDSYFFLVNFLEKMNHAIAARQLWLEQPDYEVSQPEKGVGFKGRLVVITDSHCASACLDFVDVIKRIPGVIHMGLPTSADTNYNNVAEVELPSKNFELRLPLKVFRNRSRSNNQPYYPDFLYEGDIRDTQAVQAWVMKKL